MNELQTVCAWCSPKPEITQRNLSHGICPTCSKQLKNSIYLVSLLERGLIPPYALGYLVAENKRASVIIHKELCCWVRSHKVLLASRDEFMRGWRKFLILEREKKNGQLVFA